MKKRIEHGMERPPRHRGFEAFGSRDGRYECVVKLLYAELEYDVRYVLWKRGRMDEKEEDDDWMLRQFRTAEGNLRRRLSWALKMDNGSRMSSDELLETPTEYNFRFVFDRGWGGSPDNLTNAMHNYVVNLTISEWYKLSDMNMAASYTNIADNYLRAAYYEMDNYSIEPPIFRL